MTTDQYRQIATYEDRWLRVADEHAYGFGYDGGFVETSVILARLWANEVMLRMAAFETGAVENLYAATPGATRSIATQDDGWEDALATAGDDAPSSFESQLEGYMQASSLASDRDSEIDPITASTVRELHKIACRSQVTYDTDKGPRELHHGEYKTEPNETTDRFGRTHLYCPPEMVLSEMTTALDIYRRLEADAAHPILLAAFLHWAIAHIHPFEDGNGRTARIFASIPLLKSYGVPVMVFSDARQTYFQALAAADANRPEDMVEFTNTKLSGATRWRDQLIQQRVTADLPTHLTAIAEIIAAQTEPRESDEAVLERIRTATAEAVYAALEPLEAIGITRDDLGHYYSASHGEGHHIEVSLKTPFDIRHQVHISSSIQARPAGETIITSINGELIDRQELVLELHDVSPRLSHEAQLRIAQTGDLTARELTKRLRESAATKARALGRLPIDDATPPADVT